LNTKLIIFDLDQTLVEVLEIHDATAFKLFKEFFNVEVKFSDIEYAGRSMPENFMQMGVRSGIGADVIKQKMPELLNAYERIFTEQINTNANKYILPGVLLLLESLSLTKNMVVLYTGDSRPVGEAILKATGLVKYFAKTFHATEVAVRADMVQQAINWAAEVKGRVFSGKYLVIVGDSIRDIECSRIFHTRMVAVATGFYNRERLEAELPDFVFDDFSDYRAVLKSILG